MKQIRSVKGTHDILPKDSHNWYQLESIIHNVCAKFGYKEIRTPIFEETNLFFRSVGEDTDIVSKEMYTWKDKNGTSLTLRPELTASVVRSYIQHNLGSQSPIQRLYYIGSLFRRERPQKGRQRQFHQFGVEAFGSEYPEQEAEVVAIAWHIILQVGLLKKAKLQINSIGSAKCRSTYQQALKDFFSPHLAKLSEVSQKRLIKNPLRILDTKNKEELSILKNAPKISEYYSKEDKDHFEEVKRFLKNMDIPFIINPTLVRGLDYYTKTVFEFISEDLGSQNALLGGGRYDGLVENLGGKPIPGIGFAAGMERFLLAIKENKLEFKPQPPDIYFICLDKSGIATLLNIANKLRTKGYIIISDMLRKSMKAQFKDANKLGARYVLILGEDELKNHTIRFKNLINGNQKNIKQKNIIEFFNNLKN